MIAVTNRSPEALRFHITAFRWSQSEGGEMKLEPTKDIVFFPAMLTLNKGESRQLRVGTKLKPGSIERSYRIFVQELPPLARTADERSANVRMLTKLGIPVFVEAVAPKPVAQVSTPVVQGREVSFVVRNAGNAHLVAQKIQVLVKIGGKVVHTGEPPGWYVLAGEGRRHKVALPDQACKPGASLEVRVETDDETAKAALPSFSCGGT
jgi:fimbrial chaperone protein